jgi:uncharacterized RDD family membrane protein YckC
LIQVEMTMSSADDYVNSVLSRMPRATPRRTQIGTELRGHIAERVAAGHAVDDVLRQLGDPSALAESYLAEVPLEVAPHGRRLLAKIADVALVVVTFAAVALPAAGIARAIDERVVWFALVLTIVICAILAAAYTVVAEWRFGQTVGKYLCGLRVVQESGAQITLGQSLVRQLAVFLQVFWIDALFALFTDKRQRAFEMLSKTRVVRDSDSGRLPA